MKLIREKSEWTPDTEEQQTEELQGLTTRKMTKVSQMDLQHRRRDLTSLYPDKSLTIDKLRVRGTLGPTSGPMGRP